MIPTASRPKRANALFLVWMYYIQFFYTKKEGLRPLLVFIYFSLGLNHFIAPVFPHSVLKFRLRETFGHFVLHGLPNISNRHRPIGQLGEHHIMRSSIQGTIRRRLILALLEFSFQFIDSISDIRGQTILEREVVNERLHRGLLHIKYLSGF